MRRLRDSKCSIKKLENPGCSLSVRSINDLESVTIVQSSMDVAVDIRTCWPFNAPSPKNWPTERTPTTASFPRVDKTVILTLPPLIKKIASAGPPCSKITAPLGNFLMLWSRPDRSEEHTSELQSPY